uniref:Ig-like domain-containing protein n=1 Tax=Chrysemys picta bellii TaxID=8478 RepID=A0A8C3FDW2_CHRPI
IVTLALIKCLIRIPFLGVLSEVKLVQSGPGTVKPSESVQLPCAASGFSIASSGYTCHWIRRAPGKGLEWLGYVNVYGNTRYLPDIQNRTTITVDPSKDEFYLRVDSLSPQDTATYYCARSTYRMYKPP